MVKITVYQNHDQQFVGFDWYKAVMPYVIIFLVACFFMMLFPELIVIFPNAAMGY